MPAMPESAASGSGSTVPVTCATPRTSIMPAVTATPMLYTMKNGLNSRSPVKSLARANSVAMRNTRNPSASRCGCMNPSTVCPEKPESFVNSRKNTPAAAPAMR